MITPRSQHSATVLSDGRILVAGGFGNTTTEANPVGLLTAAELYDPVTASWTATGDMAFGPGATVARALDDGRVLWVGGVVLSSSGGIGIDSTVLETADLFDPTAETP
jgi:N-acetylneuraminic acid mutarotase